MENTENTENMKSPSVWLVYGYPNLPPMAAISATQFTYPNHSDRNVIFKNYQGTFPFSNPLHRFSVPLVSPPAFLKHHLFVFGFSHASRWPAGQVFCSDTMTLGTYCTAPALGAVQMSLSHTSLLFNSLGGIPL